VTLVSDEVWRQLDPDAGRLARQTVLRLRWSMAGVLVLALLVGLAWRSGVVVPRLTWANTGYSWGGIGAGVVEYELPVTNRSWTSAEVVAIGRSGPGLELQTARAELPAMLAPGQGMDVMLVYRVTDCAAVPADAWPVPFTVRRTWGTVTAYVQPPTGISPDAPSGVREYQGRDPYAVEWQRLMADLACRPRRP
jgi:hypothetical protein